MDITQSLADLSRTQERCEQMSGLLQRLNNRADPEDKARIANILRQV